MEYPFKNLNDAKEEYTKLSEQIIELSQKSGEFDTLSVVNADLLSKVSVLVEDNKTLESKLTSLQTFITSKDAELLSLTEENNNFKTEIETMKKNTKSISQQARELVLASSASGPAPVDGSEIPSVRQQFDELKSENERIAFYREHKQELKTPTK